MNNLIKGEFYKLKKGEYFSEMIFLTVVATFFMLIHYDENLRVLDKFDPELMSGMYSIKYSYRCILFTSFMFAIFAAQFIIKDLKGNINKSFTYGYTRNKIIVNKLIAFIICCLSMQLIYTVILVYFGRAYWFDYDIENILYLTRIIVIGTMYNAATISIVAMIAIITKNRVCTAVSPVLFLLFTSIVSIKNPVSFIVAYKHPSVIVYLCPFIIGETAMERFARASDIIMAMASSVLTLSITIGISLVYIKRKDIK